MTPSTCLMLCVPSVVPWQKRLWPASGTPTQLLTAALALLCCLQSALPADCHLSYRLSIGQASCSGYWVGCSSVARLYYSGQDVLQWPAS